MKKLIFVTSIAIALCGCGGKGGAEKEKVMTTNVVLAPPATHAGAADYSVSDAGASKTNLAEKLTSSNQNVKDTSKKIVKEGEIQFETSNLPATSKAIYSSVQKLGGYIAAEQETNDGDRAGRQVVLKVRIPEKNFDVFLDNVSSNAVKIDSKNIRVKDVTTEYIDITAQLVNKKKLEERYNDLLKKGNKISDLLEIENKITEIQTDIESNQGQLNYLMRQVEYSSLDITFYTENIVKDNGQSFGGKFIFALVDGWNGLGVIFLTVVTIWPLWIIIGVLCLIIKAWRKKHPKKGINL